MWWKHLQPINSTWNPKISMINRNIIFIIVQTVFFWWDSMLISSKYILRYDLRTCLGRFRGCNWNSFHGISWWFPSQNHSACVSTTGSALPSSDDVSLVCSCSPLFPQRSRSGFPFRSFQLASAVPVINCKCTYFTLFHHSYRCTISQTLLWGCSSAWL